MTINTALTSITLLLIKFIDIVATILATVVACDENITQASKLSRVVASYHWRPVVGDGVGDQVHARYEKLWQLLNVVCNSTARLTTVRATFLVIPALLRVPLYVIACLYFLLSQFLFGRHSIETGESIRHL